MARTMMTGTRGRPATTACVIRGNHPAQNCTQLYAICAVLFSFVRLPVRNNLICHSLCLSLILFTGLILPTNEPTQPAGQPRNPSSNQPTNQQNNHPTKHSGENEKNCITLRMDRGTYVRNYIRVTGFA